MTGGGGGFFFFKHVKHAYNPPLWAILVLAHAHAHAHTHVGQRVGRASIISEDKRKEGKHYDKRRLCKTGKFLHNYKSVKRANKKRTYQTTLSKIRQRINIQ